MGLFRRSKPETRNYSDLLAEAAIAAAEGKVAKAAATAAMQTAAGLVARAFAAADLEAPPMVADAFTPKLRALVGRAMIRGGEALLVARADGLGLRLDVAGSWYVLGGWRPETWTYHPTLFGPSDTDTLAYRPDMVWHFMADSNPEAPWRGVSPLQSAVLAGKLTAEVSTLLADEAAGTRGNLLPVPADGQDASVTQLRADLATLGGKTAMVEDQREMAAPGSRVGNSSGWQPVRLGADPPPGLVELAAEAHSQCLQALGISPALFGSTSSAVREAQRGLLANLVHPLAVLVCAEIADKTGEACEMSFADLKAADVMGRGRALASMTTAGASLESAAEACGLEGLEAAPEPATPMEPPAGPAGTAPDPSAGNG